MSRKAPSPTNTSYSGISNYQSSNYRRAEPMPQLPDLQDGRQIARQHYEELQLFLGSHLARGTRLTLIALYGLEAMDLADRSWRYIEPANSRSSAREKLTRLTRQQFQELSTDVYDELIRRNNNSETNEGSPSPLPIWVAPQRPFGVTLLFPFSAFSSSARRLPP